MFSHQRYSTYYFVTKCMILKFLEMVVFIAGGNFYSPVYNSEVYSPAGGCSLAMGIAPVINITPILGIINGKFTMCGSYQDRRYNNQFKTNLLVLNLTTFSIFKEKIMLK
jgi:hypothetical protein